jgi:hypothetical protein
MKTTSFALPLALGATLVALSLTARAGDVFTFAGFTFDQRNTPNQAALLGNSVLLGGAQFSSGLPMDTTPNPVNFPQSGPGFNTNLSLAKLTGLALGIHAVNLPNGDFGATTRHGIETWWSGHYGLPNLSGDDIVIYEAASSVGGVEGVIVRVRTSPQSFDQSAQWTDWYYFPPDSFQSTVSAEGVFSYGLDFTDFGVANGVVIDRIQMANLKQADRMVGPGTPAGGTNVGVGKVVFDGTTTVLPDAGGYDANRVFDTTQLDPDPLYVGALHDVVALSPLFLSISKQGSGAFLSVFTAAGAWRIESSDALVSAPWQLMELFTNVNGGTLSFVDLGQNARPAPNTVPYRFYRMKSE